MAAKAKDTDLMKTYRTADSEERFSIMMENYAVLPNVINKAQKKTEYKIKAEREYLRSHSRGELGVRVQTSKKSDTTAEEAIANVTLEEAFATGEVDKGLLKGIEEASVYETEIKLISTMRMDFELLEDIIESYEDDDQRIIRKRLAERKAYRVIAEEEDCSYDTIKRKLTAIRNEIREEIVECLELNNREGR